MAFEGTEQNYDPKALQTWLKGRLRHYQDLGKTQVDFWDRLTSFLPSESERREDITRSVGNSLRTGRTVTLSQHRVQAIAAYIAADQKDSSLPNSVEGVKKWLSWKDPESLKADAKRPPKVKASDIISLESQLRQLETQVEDNTRLIAKLRSQLSLLLKSAEPKSELTEIVQGVLMDLGFDVSSQDVQEDVRAIAAKYEHADQIVCVILNDCSVEAKAECIGGLTGTLTDLTGGMEWATPEFQAIASASPNEKQSKMARQHQDA